MCGPFWSLIHPIVVVEREAGAQSPTWQKLPTVGWSTSLTNDATFPNAKKWWYNYVLYLIKETLIVSPKNDLWRRTKFRTLKSPKKSYLDFYSQNDSNVDFWRENSYNKAIFWVLKWDIPAFWQHFMRFVNYIKRTYMESQNDI